MIRSIHLHDAYKTYKRVEILTGNEYESLLKRS